MQPFVTVEQANIIEYSWKKSLGPRPPWGPEIWPTSKVMPDYYSMNQIIQVECLTFTLPFLKLPQNCLKLPKKMTIFMHNTQTDKFHPYVAHGGKRILPTAHCFWWYLSSSLGLEIIFWGIQIIKTGFIN